MPFQLSPGIITSEVDLTTVIPAVSTSTGAIAGVFTWGPVNTPTFITSEVDLVRTFGKPVTGFNTETFFSAADFLSYSSSLYVTRANQGLQATPTANSTLDQTGVIARYPGAAGNSLRVIMATNATYATANVQLTKVVSGAPLAGEAHIVVVDTTGALSGTANSVVEVWENVSTVVGAKTVDGTNNYFADVIETRSRYLTIDAAVTTPTISTSAAIIETLSGGTNGVSETAVAANIILAAYDTFGDADSIDVSLIMQGPAIGTANTELSNYLVGIAEARRDCVVFISPPRGAVVNNVGSELTAVRTFANALTSSSYSIVDSGYKYRYDRYNDRYIWTPLNGDIAGICARTDDTRDPWFSPAGYQRGNVKNVVKVAWNPKQSERDELYKVAVNPVITQVGQGTLLFGDKTGLKRPSAFDRINVRRLFIVLEKAITNASKATLFEFNDTFTRAQFKNMVEPYLRDVQGRRGIYDFRVVCDETNNTAQVIDSNTFVGDIYIKPARSINFIQLNFVAVRSGVEFEEIVGRS